MIILIAGATHTGKTTYAQKLLEKYRYPYLSIDHLKMGLIRSGQTNLTPMDDDKLTAYLWPIVREMVKTAIENKQNLIVEGCYIPFGWQKDFVPDYLKEIRYLCLVMSRDYIENHFDEIRNYANVIEHRLDDSDLNKDTLIAENEYNYSQCVAYGLPYLWIEEEYRANSDALKERIYAYLKTIPEGKVTTYGQIAASLGNKQYARTVGNILHDNPDPSRYPCHRVVNSQGKVAEHYAFGGAAAQRKRLEDEGVVFESNGRINLKKYGI